MSFHNEHGQPRQVSEDCLVPRPYVTCSVEQIARTGWTQAETGATSKAENRRDRSGDVQAATGATERKQKTLLVNVQQRRYVFALKQLSPKAERCRRDFTRVNTHCTITLEDIHDEKIGYTSEIRARLRTRNWSTPLRTCAPQLLFFLWIICRNPSASLLHSRRNQSV